MSLRTCVWLYLYEVGHTFTKQIGGAPTAVTTLTGFERYNFVDWTMFKHRINNRISASNKGLLYTLKTIGNERWLYTYITNDTKAKTGTTANAPN